MATKFSPCKGSYVLNQFPSNVMFGMNGFHVSASGAIQGHHGPLVQFCCLQMLSVWVSLKLCHLGKSYNLGLENTPIRGKKTINSFTNNKFYTFRN